MAIKKRTFKIKQGDRRPYLAATLAPITEAGAVGEPVDLTDATSVTFNMRDENGTVVIDQAPVVVVDAANGEVRYEWQDGDTDEPGDYRGEFQVNWDDEPETFPNDEIGFRIKITPQIA